MRLKTWQMVAAAVVLLFVGEMLNPMALVQSWLPKGGK